MRSFQEKVFSVVRAIPRGETLSYAEVARRAGFPRAWRAVGNILNKNRDPAIPCHRVIRADGSPGGYNRGSRAKTLLLATEGAIFTGRTCIKVTTIEEVKKLVIDQ